MRPAFSSARQAVCFSALVLVVFALPAVARLTCTWTRDRVYLAIHDKYGPFASIHRKIFEESGDVDMAFLGSSMLWQGVDSSMVEEALSRKLGRPASALTLGWPWPGLDAVYFIARDLLERRRVAAIAIYDEPLAVDAPHLHASRWYRYGEYLDALEDLPWRYRLGLYGAAMTGLPRQVLSLIRPDRREAAPVAWSYWKIKYRAPDLSWRSGSLAVRVSFDFDPNYTLWRPELEPPPRPALCSPLTRDAFDFSAAGSSSYQRYFLAKLVDLVRAKGTKLIILHVPELAERAGQVISMKRDWPEKWGPTVYFAGIAPRELFRGMADVDLYRLFSQKTHFNESGQRHFTRCVIPALLQAYEDTASDP